jgi:CRISPR system Cascade subunit CasB
MIPPGDVGELRRARPGDVGGPALWKIAVRHLEPAGLLPSESAPWRDSSERAWTAILGGMADMAGLHTGGARPGRVLAEREVSEHRVNRLLRARGEALLGLVRTVARQLASRGARVDWTDLANLVLRDGTEWQDRIRRRIALDYYSHLNR